MDMAMMIARSGLEAHHRNIEVISNNLANANTAGFKRDRAEFEDLPYQVITQAGSPLTQDVNLPSNVAIGTGTKLSSNKKIFVQGNNVQTGNDLDVMIQGRGFFQIQLPNGNYAYTRDGRFQPNDQAQITTSKGYILQPPITIPQGTQRIDISEDGIVSAVTADSAGTPQQIGQLQVADFVNPDGLLPLGGNLYQETIASGAATLGNPSETGLGSLKQRNYEASNVNVVEEMVNLIEAQRAFEVTSKAVSSVDNMLQTLSREV